MLNLLFHVGVTVLLGSIPGTKGPNRFDKVAVEAEPEDPELAETESA